ncbi:uncharacterized protein THITE_2106698 [Thermothielavioides terrestris NRRL 8126]|uniref:Uncharacterized protein n=1 Tax=Thermothielavioides terrestris (strain ATCC 38088 / NRRL 8126) TaxID=578455 RepID=G2QR33_THETT|nr:uncharacterized protein THITE_2106698 [Thermothielavioides terrestris NRRL 8126]AEO62485.1 hypothetical protein THITE_2106698 [Thermothielavioides terrestris NRRL 8126]
MSWLKHGLCVLLVSEHTAFALDALDLKAKAIPRQWCTLSPMLASVWIGPILTMTVIHASGASFQISPNNSVARRLRTRFQM